MPQTEPETAAATVRVEKAVAVLDRLLRTHPELAATLSQTQELGNSNDPLYELRAAVNALHTEFDFVVNQRNAAAHNTTKLRAALQRERNNALRDAAKEIRQREAERAAAARERHERYNRAHARALEAREHVLHAATPKQREEAAEELRAAETQELVAVLGSSHAAEALVEASAEEQQRQQQQHQQNAERQIQPQTKPAKIESPTARRLRTGGRADGGRSRSVFARHGPATSPVYGPAASPSAAAKPHSPLVRSGTVRSIATTTTASLTSSPKAADSPKKLQQLVKHANTQSAPAVHHSQSASGAASTTQRRPSQRTPRARRRPASAVARGPPGATRSHRRRPATADPRTRGGSLDSDAMSATSDGVSRGMVEFHKRYPRTVVPMAAGDRYGDWVCGNLQQAAVRARAKLLRGTILHWTMRNVDSEDSRPGTAGDGGDSASNAGVDRVIQEALADIYAKAQHRRRRTTMKEHDALVFTLDPLPPPQLDVSEEPHWRRILARPTTPLYATAASGRRSPTLTATAGSSTMERREVYTPANSRHYEHAPAPQQRQRRQPGASRRTSVTSTRSGPQSAMSRSARQSRATGSGRTKPGRRQHSNPSPYTQTLTRSGRPQSAPSGRREALRSAAHSKRRRRQRKPSPASASAAVTVDPASIVQHTPRRSSPLAHGQRDDTKGPSSPTPKFGHTASPSRHVASPAARRAPASPAAGRSSVKPQLLQPVLGNKGSPRASGGPRTQPQRPTHAIDEARARHEPAVATVVLLSPAVARMGQPPGAEGSDGNGDANMEADSVLVGNVFVAFKKAQQAGASGKAKARVSVGAASAKGGAARLRRSRRGSAGGKAGKRKPRGRRRKHTPSAISRSINRMAVFEPLRTQSSRARLVSGSHGGKQAATSGQAEATQQQEQQQADALSQLEQVNQQAEASGASPRRSASPQQRTSRSRQGFDMDLEGMLDEDELATQVLERSPTGVGDKQVVSRCRNSSAYSFPRSDRNMSFVL